MRAIFMRHLVALNFSELDDTGRHNLVTGVQQSAKNSALVQGNPAMQATIAALGQSDDTLKQANVTVAQDKQKLSADLAAETTARGAVDGDLRTLIAQTQGTAKTPADVISVGLPYRSPVVAKKGVPDAPLNLVQKIPKRGHGRVTVSVEDATSPRLDYVAEWSPDPIGTWSQLGTGLGKTRLVTGASGTKIWVRFAALRGQAQSEWSTPVLVSIP
jgi:hypothetical protein